MAETNKHNDTIFNNSQKGMVDLLSRGLFSSKGQPFGAGDNYEPNGEFKYQSIWSFSSTPK